MVITRSKVEPVQELENRLIAKLEKKHGKSVQELYQERNKRLVDTVALKVPDRVSVDVAFGYFPAKYLGIPTAAAYYDYDLWLDATMKTAADFDPDSIWYINGFSSGKTNEDIDPKSMRWPGHGVERGHQAIEGEWIFREMRPAADPYRFWLVYDEAANRPSELPRLSRIAPDLIRRLAKSAE